MTPAEGREQAAPEEDKVVHVCLEVTYCDTCDPLGLNTYNGGGW